MHCVKLALHEDLVLCSFLVRRLDEWGWLCLFSALFWRLAFVDFI
jgi:hypothetical protein